MIKQHLRHYIIVTLCIGFLSIMHICAASADEQQYVFITLEQEANAGDNAYRMRSIEGQNQAQLDQQQKSFSSTHTVSYQALATLDKAKEKDAKNGTVVKLFNSNNNKEEALTFILKQTYTKPAYFIQYDYTKKPKENKIKINNQTYDLKVYEYGTAKGNKNKKNNKEITLEEPKTISILKVPVEYLNDIELFFDLHSSTSTNTTSSTLQACRAAWLLYEYLQAKNKEAKKDDNKGNKNNQALQSFTLLTNNKNDYTYTFTPQKDGKALDVAIEEQQPNGEKERMFIQLRKEQQDIPCENFHHLLENIHIQHAYNYYTLTQHTAHYEATQGTILAEKNELFCRLKKIDATAQTIQHEGQEINFLKLKNEIHGFLQKYATILHRKGEAYTPNEVYTHTFTFKNARKVSSYTISKIELSLNPESYNKDGLGVHTRVHILMTFTLKKDNMSYKLPIVLQEDRLSKSLPVALSGATMDSKDLNLTYYQVAKLLSKTSKGTKVFSFLPETSKEVLKKEEAQKALAVTTVTKEEKAWKIKSASLAYIKDTEEPERQHVRAKTITILGKVPKEFNKQSELSSAEDKDSETESSGNDDDAEQDNPSLKVGDNSDNEENGITESLNGNDIEHVDPQDEIIKDTSISTTNSESSPKGGKASFIIRLCFVVLGIVGIISWWQRDVLYTWYKKSARNNNHS